MIFGKHVNRYYIKYGITFLLGAVALIFVDIAQLKIPEIIREITNGLKGMTLTQDVLKQFIFDFCLIALVMFIGRFAWRVCIFGNGIRIESDMRDRMFYHTERLSQEYLSESKTGALMALYTNDLNMIRVAFGQGTIMFIDALFLGILTFIKMYKIDWLLSIICCIPLLLLAASGGVIGKYLSQKYERSNKAYADLTDFTQESFSGISVIKAFVKEGKELYSFSKRNKENMDRSLDFVKLSVLLQTLIGIFISSISVIIIGYGGYLIYAYSNGTPKEFNVGQLTEFVAYFSTLTWPMMAVAQLINMRSQANASIKRVSNLLDHPLEINDKLCLEKDNIIEGKITFKNLSFSYPNTTNIVLKDINLTIEKGTMVGIIGATGSGKTTLVDLLLRLYNIDQDKIYLDDKDIMTLPLKGVRNNIAYVPQDNFLFSDTIKNNIGFSREDVSIEEIIEIAKLADIDENVQEFPHKYETILGERGVSVSGGQKQRISIARAFLKNAPILILDDSVSAVDTKTEEAILTNLRKVRKGKTTILIAHRISTVQNLDKVMLIDDGEIIGYDTHEKLLKDNEKYKLQVELQKLKEEVEGLNNGN